MNANLPVKARIESLSASLTATERKLCTALLLDYPFAGLDTIQSLAQKTQTSPPSISRFVSKLGFSGYQSFQRQLIGELKEGNGSPLDLHRNNRALQGEFLEDFINRATAMLSESASAVTQSQFDRICALFANEKRSIYVIGGRISDTIALYLSRHLRQMRGKVYHLPSDPEIWPEYLLRMKPRDVLFVVDFRRYQPSLRMLAEQAATRQGAQVVVLTDKWLSPIAKFATEVIATPIENGTVWDTYAGALVLMEATVTQIAEGRWDKVSKRIEQWDSMRLDRRELSDDQ